MKLVNIVGGLSREKQLRLISYTPDVLIATPGRLDELLQNEGKALNLDHLRFLVIDEADRMVEMGHFKEVDNILDRIFNKEVETFDDVLEKEKRQQKRQERAESKEGKEGKSNKQEVIQ